MPLMETSEIQESGALSARLAAWQSRGGIAAAALGAMAATLLAAPAHAVPGGELGTMPVGVYLCELPGDAGGPWRVRQPDEDFEILGSSTYRAGGARGSYLLTSGQLVMTSGPFDGKRYDRQSRGFVRLMEDGKPGKLRCVLSKARSR
jgi:hypothetical protein